MNSDQLNLSIIDIIEWIAHEDFKGYDPYDALNSRIANKIPSKYMKVFLTQLFLYLPLNLRPLIGIKKEINPKALGLILRAYCNIYKSGLIEDKSFKKQVKYLDKIINNVRSKGYSGHCWGFNFPWQGLKRYLPPYGPTIVVTSTIANAYLDLYEITKEKKYLEIAKSSCKFILGNLNRYENQHGICFSYTPIDNNVVHNASLLGSEILARVSYHTDDEVYYAHSKKAIDFSLSYQKPDGSWSYSMDPAKDTERMQIDFHQGFVLDSLLCFRKYGNEGSIDRQIKKGADFYFKRQFSRDGMTLWRYPKRYPKDIHHQSQGLITSYKMYEAYKKTEYIEIHKKILDKMLKEFINGHKIYFQKWFFNNNIQYLRWSHAWALLALSYSADLQRILKNRK